MLRRTAPRARLLARDVAHRVMALPALALVLAAYGPIRLPGVPG
ncbi:hypothetical protein FRAAL2533 [Frankia alni ACN14a]|uniref:Uncharacterized protein n=1 Tax=Frankia alni (strain DSM 45986 / CECT 9034 / ACN14a) TaxID=326424 RepID=Q0RMR7_FRAAA|nr:hypothetical protein FRAAL2533 [Frankia alni ACN14a]